MSSRAFRPTEAEMSDTLVEQRRRFRPRSGLVAHSDPAYRLIDDHLQRVTRGQTQGSAGRRGAGWVAEVS